MDGNTSISSLMLMFCQSNLLPAAVLQFSLLWFQKHVQIWKNQVVLFNTLIEAARSCFVLSFCFIWSLFSHLHVGLMSVSVCRCCCFFKRKRKKNTPRHKWSSTTGLKRSKCPAQLIVISEINKVPFRVKEGDNNDLDWNVLWRDPLKMVCWDVQDAHVLWWESFL